MQSVYKNPIIQISLTINISKNTNLREKNVVLDKTKKKKERKKKPLLIFFIKDNRLFFTFLPPDCVISMMSSCEKEGLKKNFFSILFTCKSMKEFKFKRKKKMVIT